ncbi:hypothetical protein [Sulfuricurvum sp.]|uniref:hypothetical protein n=1 Tax=Sulfuricurvum sp. TaxID=2025608 RepID=UPI0019902404|nr:hypothetical protein [Sulfuricurvum sp.]MBD3805521.1 hypothetical protein [Sulfuricurvum sp.]
MSKNETLFIRFVILLVLATTLCGEIRVGILASIESNAKQTILYQNTAIACIPFGVIPLEKMVENGESSEECRKQIGEFYRLYPHKKAFAREHLYLQQTYHYENIEQGCILYANGAETWSERLLSEGIALIDPRFNNIEWNGRLKKAQMGAKRSKAGLHDTLIQKFCIK